MKSFLKTTKGKICAAAAAVLLVACAIWGGYEIWLYQQPKFHDLTVELGTDSISMSDFLTEYARPKRVAFVSDATTIDLNVVGETELTLRHGSKEETVILKIQDTTAPTANFVTERTELVDYIPTAKDFVTSVEDMSKTNVYFKEFPMEPDDYADQMVTVVVEDIYGNAIQQDCVLSYQWLQAAVALEYGVELTKADLLLDPEKDEDLLDQADIDAINASDVGDYVIISSTPAKTLECVVTVQDTLGPELELQETQVYKGSKLKLEKIVASATDASGDVELRLMTEIDTDTVGSYTVVVEAEDRHGNITSAETTVYVTTDVEPPVLKGLTALTVDKHSDPDLLEGVTATDKVDGSCKVTYDKGSLDLSKAGTYYITYSATDTSGNKATGKRRVVVNHDEEDTKALVTSIAAGLSNDPEELRNYVRKGINYSTNWGGDDPVWYGFTNKSGNCYVHALCLQALFNEKGIENQLIWVTDKTHYWLLVKIDGAWKHIDPTPSILHSKYSLMSDSQRLSTLSGRKWDTTQWPACE